MKLFIVLCIVLCLSISAFAQITIVPGEADTTLQLNTQIIIMNQQIQELKSSVSNIPTKAEFDSSFTQLDKKITDSVAGSSFSNLGYIVLGILLNDVLILCFFILTKNRLLGD